MKVRISSAGIADLAEALLHGDCLCVPAQDETCEVLHPYAEDEREAKIELAFFLRAWQLGRPGLQAELAA
jgi:hypothetical protein